MITKKSTGTDWLAASPEARSRYVTKACQDCFKHGLGVVDSSLVTEGITEFFSIPRLHKKSVHFIFGEVFSATRHLGHYRRLLDSYRVGP
jgi:hypothetical protein